MSTKSWHPNLVLSPALLTVVVQTTGQSLLDVSRCFDRLDSGSPFGRSGTHISIFCTLFQMPILWSTVPRGVLHPLDHGKQEIDSLSKVVDTWICHDELCLLDFIYKLHSLSCFHFHDMAVSCWSVHLAIRIPASTAFPYSDSIVPKDSRC